MLFVTFQTGDDLYALAADAIVEILPLVEMRRVREAPPEIAGWFSHRGAFAPAVDLSLIAQGRPAARRMSTRILMVRHMTGAQALLMGLIAEKATETLRADPKAFAPFVHSRRGPVERVEVESLVPAPLAAWLHTHRQADAG